VLKKIWQDPVWSKVIAAVILAALTGVGGLLWQSLGAFLLGVLPIGKWLLGLLCLTVTCESTILVALLRKRPSKAPSHKSAITNGDDDQNKIQITFPRPGEILSDPQPLGDGRSYPVRGRLRSLPKGHEIWLLTANERSNEFWPQGFKAGAVIFDERTGEWHGRIAGSRESALRIFAAVAPPTSQDLFRYYQSRGDATTQYVPLDRIPPECANVCSVQAKLP
jgi:hypothetical protein